MKLPGADKAEVSKDKLLGYVLSETHVTGKFKAKFFRGFGFNEMNVELFDKILHTIANSHEITDVLTSSYGTKYVIDGKIKTPTGKIIEVRTVWIIEKGMIVPRFVTVYPV